MKTFFNKYGAANQRGRQANNEVYRFADDFFARWETMGYDNREILSIIIEEVTVTAAERRLRKSILMVKEEYNVIS